jgi:pimeloyl-ACP methyl ester carboxylesterase
MKNTQDAAPVIGSVDLEDAEMQFLHWLGDGPNLLLLHATGFLPWIWLPVVRRLGRAFSITAPYHCSHRMADPRAGGLSWAILARDTVDFCAARGIVRPLAAGHSMGATVATLAHASMGLPMEKMALIEPIFLPRFLYTMELKVEDHPLAGKSIKRRNLWEDREEARRYLREKPLFKNWDEEALDLYVQHGMRDGGGGIELACHPEREAALFMGGVQRDPWPLLPEVSCPVLVIEGETSANREHIDLKKAASLIPKGGYAMVREAGHLVPMEKPDETAALVREFFTKD